jgi:uncharacterized alpha-E superfamily protein
MMMRGNTMLSRVADSLYWMSRYLERAEHTARLIDVDVQLRLDRSPDASSVRLTRLHEALHIPVPAMDTPYAHSLAHTLTFDRTNSSSIVSCIAAARENLRHVREQCSTEMWEQLNRLYLQMRSTSQEEAWLAQSHQFYRSVQDGANLFHGITDSTMTHSEGWHYIQLGRYVERTDVLAGLIASHVRRFPNALDQAVESEEYLEWVSLLKSCTAFLPYCKTYTAELRPLRVVEFLLLNPEFPHSVRFSVDMVHVALRALGEFTERKAEQPLRLAGRLRATLSFTQIDEILLNGAAIYLENIRSQCAQIHTAIHQVYFDYLVDTAMVS